MVSNDSDLRAPAELLAAKIEIICSPHEIALFSAFAV